ncbi:MAG: putative ABC transport system permease protein, partial [Gammaproteobacteria bacterium]
MFKNYFKIAWRRLWKHKLFSAINIISLAIGFSASFVIGLMVYYDLTFDKFHPDRELIYRVTSTFITSDSEGTNAGIAMPYINEVKSNNSAVAFSSGIHVANLQKVKEEATKKTFKNPEYILFTDSEYFQIFKYN